MPACRLVILDLRQSEACRLVILRQSEAGRLVILRQSEAGMPLIGGTIQLLRTTFLATFSPFAVPVKHMIHEC